MKKVRAIHVEEPIFRAIRREATKRGLAPADYVTWIFSQRNDGSESGESLLGKITKFISTHYIIGSGASLVSDVRAHVSYGVGVGENAVANVITSAYGVSTRDTPLGVAYIGMRARRDLVARAKSKYLMIAIKELDKQNGGKL